MAVVLDHRHPQAPAREGLHQALKRVVFPVFLTPLTASSGGQKARQGPSYASLEFTLLNQKSGICSAEVST